MSLFVLVCDDSMTMRRIVVDSVRAITDAEIVEASSGEEALGILRERPEARLVLLDWHMPGMTGLDVVEVMQGDESLATVPVVMVTSEREKQNVITALRMGARNYIVKPFTRQVFRKKLEQFLEAPEGEDEPQPSGGMVGNLSHTSPVEVVQLVSITKKTGVLKLMSDGTEHRLYLREGQIVDAESAGPDGILAGEEAMASALDVAGGSFSFVPAEVSRETSIGRKTEIILLEHMSRQP